MDGCTLCTLGDEPGCEACRAEEPGGEPAPSIVYRIRHVPTGRLYVGKHKLPPGWANPFEDDGYTGGGYHLARAIDAHGWSEFRKDVLAVRPTEEAALELEAGLVGPEQVASPRYFNLCVGGSGGLTHLSEEAERRRLEAVTAANRAKAQDPAWLEATAAAQRRPEARKKNRAARKRRLASDPDAREQLRAAQEEARTPESCGKRRASQRAFYADLTPEERAAWRESQAERNRSTEGRRKNSAGQRRRYANETAEQNVDRRRAIREGLQRAKAERERVRREVAAIFLALVLDKYGDPEAAA